MGSWGLGGRGHRVVESKYTCMDGPAATGRGRRRCGPSSRGTNRKARTCNLAICSLRTCLGRFDPAFKHTRRPFSWWRLSRCQIRCDLQGTSTLASKTGSTDGPRFRLPDEWIRGMPLTSRGPQARPTEEAHWATDRQLHGDMSVSYGIFVARVAAASGSGYLKPFSAGVDETNVRP